ncbi:unnamed protein product [Closterium sp. NIES-54]
MSVYTLESSPCLWSLLWFMLEWPYVTDLAAPQRLPNAAAAACATTALPCSACAVRHAPCSACATRQCPVLPAPAPCTARPSAAQPCLAAASAALHAAQHFAAPSAAIATAAAIATFAAATAATALATTTVTVTASMGTPTVLTSDAEGHSIQFESWLEVSLSAPEALAEPAADAWEEVWTQYRCLELPLTCPALSDLTILADKGGCSGAGGSGGGGWQQLESSCVAAYVPTSTGAVPAEALLSVPIMLAESTSGLVYAHPSPVFLCLVFPSDSSGSTEGGDPAAADTATCRHSPRLETPPGLPPRTSSPPLQPVAADFGGLGVVGGGGSGGVGSGGAGSDGAGSGGADSGSARSPLVGRLRGIGNGGAGSGDALQSPPRWPIFLEQSSSSSQHVPTPTCTTPPLVFPPPDSPLPAPARYSPLLVSLTGCRMPVSCASSPSTTRITREHVVLPLLPPSSCHSWPCV